MLSGIANGYSALKAPLQVRSAKLTSVGFISNWMGDCLVTPDAVA